MPSCPHCKHVVTLYYDKYRCGYCSVWLGLDEVLPNALDLSSAHRNTINIPTETQRHLTSNHTVDKSSEQTPVGQNRSKI